VVRHGWLVYERCYGKGNREANPAMASVGKACASIACGVMLHEKHDQIPDGLNQKVFTEKCLPETFPLSDSAKADITLGQLLSMSAGMHGDGNNPGFVHGESAKVAPAPAFDPALDQDLKALWVPPWTSPRGGYSYCAVPTRRTLPQLSGVT
jgi:hypothetical protein